jgi:hypothetical protein
MFLESIAEQLGFTPKVEEFRPGVFSSAWIIYSTQSAQLRLVWDDKDGVGFLESRGHATDKWETISEIMTESDAESTPKNEKKFAEFRRAVEASIPLSVESRTSQKTLAETSGAFDRSFRKHRFGALPHSAESLLAQSLDRPRHKHGLLSQ